MKKIILALSLISLISLPSYASEKVLLQDKFNDNLNVWTISIGKNFKTDISGGRYIIENKDTSTLLTTQLFPTKIDQKTNFKIEAEIKKISGLDNNSYDLVWGFKDKNNFYSFGVAGNGSFRYGKWVGGKYLSIQNWSKSPFINKNNAKNKLAVSKKDNKLFFFVNHNQIGSVNYETFSGDKQGIMLQTKMKVEVDNFIITQDSKNSIYNDLLLDFDNNPPQITILEPNVKRGFEVVTKDQLIKVRGIAKDLDGIAELRVNGVNTEVNDSGEFTAYIKLNYGENTIKVTATDKTNKTSNSNFQIVYEKDINNSVPEITILEPNVKRGFEVVSKDELIKVRGTAKDNSGLSEVRVNGVNAQLGTSGEFTAYIKLDKGNNQINVIATNKNNKTSSNTFQIVYKNDPVVNNLVKNERSGKDYAVLFATDKYDNWSKLVNPVNDAQTIKNELKDNYNFNAELVENPTKYMLKSKLREYALKKYEPDDQLFIFIAGHGQFDSTYKEGYIVTKDSLVNDDIKDSYISHSELSTIVNNIGCKHIFLVMDVCFGGTFDQRIAQRGEDETYKEATKTEFIQRKMKNKTRIYLTSGGKEYVPDGRPGQHSPFARKFLEALRSYGGNDGILSQSELNNYLDKLIPEPKYGEFGNNEPGSDFIFVTH